MNKLLKKTISCIVAGAAVLGSVFVQPDLGGGLNVAASAAELSASGWSGNYSVDNGVHPAGCTYSIKIENSSYTINEVKRTFDVKNGVTYLFSAKVKYSGYALAGDAEADKSGACIGTGFSWSRSSYTTDSDWVQLSYVFTASDSDKYDLSLYNGFWDAYCKGTAWYSDIKLERLTAENCGWYTDASNYYTVSVDTKTTYNKKPYSIKVVNNDYAVSEVKKLFAVKPDTYYRLTAMVKCSGISVDPKAENKNTGALIGQNFSYSNSAASRSGKWTKLEYEFYSGDNSEYIVSLKNGLWNGRCKGTVWFGDVRLEEASETTNQWNMLTIFFTKANGTGTLSNGKKQTIVSSYSNSTVEEYKKLINGLYDDLEKVSGGLVDVRNIDYKVSDLTLTAFVPYDYKDQWGTTINCLQYDLDTEEVANEMTRLIGDGVYQQLLLIVPVSDTFGWWGLTGGGFNGINCSTVTVGSEDFMVYSGYPTNVFIHEFAHGLEHNSNSLREKPIANLHAKTDFGYKGDDEADNYKWYTAYYQNKIKGGTGIDPRVFNKTNGKYTLVSDDLTTGAGVEAKGTLLTHISDVITVSKIEDRYYSGKAVKPSVKVEGAVKGTDYTVSYSDNKSVGTAKAIIKGKGKYTGTVEVTFKIKLKKTTAKVKSSKLSWSKVAGADGYEIYYSKDGGNYKKLADTTALKYDLSKLKKGTYKFKVCAYSNTNSGKVTADRSKAVKFTKK